MDDLIDFGGSDQLQLEAPEQPLAIEDDPSAPKKPSRSSKKAVEYGASSGGADLLNFDEEDRKVDADDKKINSLLGLDSDNDEIIKLDHDSDDDQGQEDEFGPIEPGQKRIFVVCNEIKFPVNWYEDTPISDVKEMIICACDSIIDSGFELLSPDDGQPIDINKISNIRGRGEKFTIIKSEEKKEYEKLLGDRWRKIVLEVEPLRHIEAQKAVEYMRHGSNLLCNYEDAYPNIRLFQLSSDLKKLIWFVGNKSLNECYIDLRKITHISIGQKTKKFKKYPQPALAHLSFSVHFKHKKKEDTLDLTCKDELEFDLWVTGIRALSYHYKGFNINKMLLLGHSRAFNEDLKNKNIGSANKFLIDQDQDKYESKQLVDCLRAKPLNSSQLQDKLVVIGKKIRSKRQKVEEVADEIAHNPAGNDAVGMGYKMISSGPTENLGAETPGANAEEETNTEIQITRMMDILDSCEKEFDEVSKTLKTYIKNKSSLPEDYAGIPKRYRSDPLRYMDSQVWKIEIDLENIDDIITRLNSENHQTIREQLKSFLPSIF